jgi:hypothetical protein
MDNECDIGRKLRSSYRCCQALRISWISNRRPSDTGGIQLDLDTPMTTIDFYWH